MVRAHPFSFRAGNFSSAVAHRALSDAGRNLCVALSYMVRARIEPQFDTIAFASACHGAGFFATTGARLVALFYLAPFQTHSGSCHRPARESSPVLGRRRLENAHGFSGVKKARIGIALLKEIITLLEEENWRYSVDTGWQEWDLQIYGNFWWSIVLQTVTEYHGGGKCLTRARLLYRYVTTTVLVNLIVLSLLIYHVLNTRHLPLFFIVPYVLVHVFLATRAQRLRSRVAELIDLAAYRIGLTSGHEGEEG